MTACFKLTHIADILSTHADLLFFNRWGILAHKSNVGWCIHQMVVV